MAKNNTITIQDVQHLAKLANLPIDKSKYKKLQEQLGSILDYVRAVQTAPTENTPETTQVTGLSNVWREDVVDNERMLTQEEALSNAKRTHDGYFVVDAVIET